MCVCVCLYPNSVFLYIEICVCADVGLNVPELQVRMLFSTQSWSCSQHSLPSLHYLHSGADVIWSVVAVHSPFSVSYYSTESIDAICIYCCFVLMR